MNSENNKDCCNSEDLCEKVEIAVLSDEPLDSVLQQHCQSCPKCQAFLSNNASLLSQLSGLEYGGIKQGELADRVMEKVKSTKTPVIPKFKVTHHLGTAAAVVIICAVALIAKNMPSEAPTETIKDTSQENKTSYNHSISPTASKDSDDSMILHTITATSENEYYSANVYEVNTDTSNGEGYEQYGTNYASDSAPSSETENAPLMLSAHRSADTEEASGTSTVEATNDVAFSTDSNDGVPSNASYSDLLDTSGESSKTEGTQSTPSDEADDIKLTSPVRGIGSISSGGGSSGGSSGGGGGGGSSTGGSSTGGSSGGGSSGGGSTAIPDANDDSQNVETEEFAKESISESEDETIEDIYSDSYFIFAQTVFSQGEDSLDSNISLANQILLELYGEEFCVIDRFCLENNGWGGNEFFFTEAPKLTYNRILEINSSSAPISQ